MSIAYPQSDDCAGYVDADRADYDEVMTDLREMYGEEEDYGGAPEGIPHWSDPNSGLLCDCGYLHSACVCGAEYEQGGEDGYESGGHMDYWHAQYDA